MSDKSGKSSSRSRGPNFSKEEQLLLFTVIEPYTQIIESKKTDSIKHIDKQNAWSKVTEVFNANTKGVPRSRDNIISCYRNIKSKLKKQHSEAKMLLSDPIKKDAIITAIEESGKDWEVISQSINVPIDVCTASFKELEKEIKKEDLKLKKAILGTGGGPPPTDEGGALQKIKKIIDPQIDGLFTLYDGDAEIMTQYQSGLPESERRQPIEHVSKNNDTNIIVTADVEDKDTNAEKMKHVSSVTTSNNGGFEIHETPIKFRGNRIDILRKRTAPELTTKDIKRKKNC